MLLLYPEGMMASCSSGRACWSHQRIASRRAHLPCLLPTRPQEVIVIETPAAREATQEILRLNAIPAMVSKDLEDVLAKANSEGAPQAAAAPAEAAPSADVGASEQQVAAQQRQEAQAGEVAATAQ